LVKLGYAISFFFVGYCCLLYDYFYGVIHLLSPAFVLLRVLEVGGVIIHLKISLYKVMTLKGHFVMHVSKLFLGIKKAVRKAALECLLLIAKNSSQYWSFVYQLCWSLSCTK